MDGHAALRACAAGALALIRAFVPQRGRVPEGVTVHDAVTIGRSAHLRVLQRATRADREAVDRALARTGVEGFRDRQLSTLSGGELQRVQIAVALAQEAPVLMADEPTSQLDLGATVEVAKLLRGPGRRRPGGAAGGARPGLAAAVADSVVVIHQGRSVATGPPDRGARRGAPARGLGRGRVAGDTRSPHRPARGVARASRHG